MKPAGLALGFAGLAYIATVKQQPVMRLRDEFRRDIFDELPLRLQRILTIRGQTNSFAYAEDMRIYRHRCLSPLHGAYDIGRLASYARKGLQIVNIIRHLSAIDLCQSLGRCL